MTILQQMGPKAKTILGGLALTAFLGAALPAAAHEFILKPDTATPPAGQKTRVQAQASHVFMISEEAENPATVRLQILQNGKATSVNLSEDAALAASTGVDLGLDNPHGTAKFLGCFHGFLHRECGNAARNGHTKIAQDFLALVFVNLHEVSLREGW